ncbi:MAG TPA: hypothetical protein VFE17_01555 [Candidatus Baltobacteraceae bacterium]|nr:hypothetical protein [Candidatus Baltobacteraceae bacterium]
MDHIDGLDALFAVIMTGVLAVVLLAIDRFRIVGRFPDVFIGWIAIALLAVAFYHCVRGIWRGNEGSRAGSGELDARDAPDPARLLSGVVREGPEKAIVGAAHDAISNRTANLAVRNYKRAALKWALIFLTLGTVLAGAAKVVYSVCDGSERGASAASQASGKGAEYSGETSQQTRLLFL